MTFEEFWRENEKALAAQFYREGKWTNIHGLLKVVFERNVVKEGEMNYRVLWDNGHASGTLPGVYDTREAAEDAGKDWKTDMVSIDPDPEEAEEEYDWEVIEEAENLPSPD